MVVNPFRVAPSITASLLLAVSACTPEAGSPASHPAGAGSVLAIDSVPSLVIGSEGSEPYQFSSIAGLGRLSSGEWFVFDSGANELRFYDPAGAFLRKAGRSGEGPGEFRLVLHAAATPDDRIYVYDSSLRRLTEFDPAGTVTAIYRIPDQPDGSSVLHAIGPGSDRTYVFSAFRTPPCIENALTTDTVTYFAYGLPGSTRQGPPELDSLATVPGRLRWGNTINVLAMCLPNPVPFFLPPIARTAFESLYLAFPEEAVVRVVEMSGGETAEFRAAVSRRALASTRVDSFIAEATGTTPRDENGNPLGDPAGARLLARRLREMPYPDSVPALDQFVVDREGRLWLRQYASTGDRLAKWSVVDAAAEARQEVMLPVKFRVFEIGEDYVAGVDIDELDVQRVKVFGLRRATR